MRAKASLHSKTWASIPTTKTPARFRSKSSRYDSSERLSSSSSFRSPRAARRGRRGRGRSPHRPLPELLEGAFFERLRGVDDLAGVNGPVVRRAQDEGQDRAGPAGAVGRLEEPSRRAAEDPVRLGHGLVEPPQELGL